MVDHLRPPLLSHRCEDATSGYYREWMTLDLRTLRSRFRDDAQLAAVQNAVMLRLADDCEQDECRYLMRFWWQLAMSYREVSYEQLEEHLSAAKMEIIQKLLSAVQVGHDAIDRWLEEIEAHHPIVEDRGRGLGYE